MTIEIELNERALARLRQMAENRNTTIERVLQDMVECVLESQASDDVVLGMFAQEPELIDEVVAEAMEARKSDPLRQHSG
ncbi:MAG: hypothetical protein R6V13_04595 [Anaerolineae bacterium]